MVKKDSPSSDSLISLLFTTRRLIRERVNLCDASYPLSHLQSEILKYVADHPLSTMHSLASYMSVTRPSATSLINGLVRNGYLLRVRNQKDHRQVCLKMTKKGMQMLERHRMNVQKKMRSILGNLSVGEQRDLERILRKLHSFYAA